MTSSRSSRPGFMRLRLIAWTCPTSSSKRSVGREPSYLENDISSDPQRRRTKSHVHHKTNPGSAVSVSLRARRRDVHLPRAGGRAERRAETSESHGNFASPPEGTVRGGTKGV